MGLRLGLAGAAQDQGAAGHDLVGVADAIDGNQALHRNAVAVGDCREAFTRLDLVGFGVLVHGHPWAGAGARHLDAAAGPEVIGVPKAIQANEAIDAGAVAVRDFREGLTRFDGVVARAATAVDVAGHLDAAARPEVIGIAQTVHLHQPIDRRPVAIGDFGEGFTALDHHLAGNPRKGEQKGQG